MKDLKINPWIVIALQLIVFALVKLPNLDMIEAIIVALVVGLTTLEFTIRRVGNNKKKEKERLADKGKSEHFKM